MNYHPDTLVEDLLKCSTYNQLETHLDIVFATVESPSDFHIGLSKLVWKIVAGLSLDIAIGDYIEFNIFTNEYIIGYREKFQTALDVYAAILHYLHAHKNIE